MDIQKSESVALFGKLMRTHDQLLQKSLNVHGVYRGQHFVLFYVNDHPGVSPSELALKFGISKASLGATIARMVKSGLMYREPDVNDARRYHLYTSDDGKQAATKCFKQVKHLQDMMFSEFDQDDQIKANELFIKMIEGLLKMEND